MISSWLSAALSMITLTNARLDASTTARMSSSTAAHSPPLMRPMAATMSTSVAPRAAS